MILSGKNGANGQNAVKHAEKDFSRRRRVARKACFGTETCLDYNMCYSFSSVMQYPSPAIRILVSESNPDFRSVR